MKPEFDTSIRDSQSTFVEAIAPERFDIEAYADYEASLNSRQKEFLCGDRNLLVYRRVRADGVFYDKCRDYKESLALQLGALQTSMKYKADVANFLEPWYGIGYIAAAFGAEYDWLPGQAPSVKPMFHSVEELLKAERKPIADTETGKHILNMEEYFLDKTKGKLPISFCDVQSPLNMLSYLLPITDLFIEVYDDPEGLAEAANLVGDLLLEFLAKQKSLLGDCLALPGHGFASSRLFKGIGMSNDNSIMLRDEDYLDIFAPADKKIGEKMDGYVYHSCGNWGKKIQMVQSIKGIVCADGAFSIETDPDPNDPEQFAAEFAGKGIILNARAVGNIENTANIFKKLMVKNQKVIAVTYCKDPEEQAALYDLLHEGR